MRSKMNNQIPFIYPYQPIYQPQININDFDKLLSKIEKIENNMSILEKRISHLENNESKNIDNNDMHFV